MIIVTGANGFIGANIALSLVDAGREVAIVDDFPDGLRYVEASRVAHVIEQDTFHDWLCSPAAKTVTGIIHMGACSDTTQTDRDFMMRNNLEYTRQTWLWCAANSIPLVYASSAATYGDGSEGYDDQADPSKLKPLNLYGESKHLFDLWALEQSETPPRWAGVKFFNVYGPREQHKGRMASVAYHSYHQIKDSGKVKLFKSHKEGYEDGGQMRDFVYVRDAVDASIFLLDTPASESAPNGLYNVGSGQARTFRDFASAAFAGLGLEPSIEYIPMPEDLQGKYQYFTEAKIEKLKRAGFNRETYSIERGVGEYMKWLEESAR